MLDKAPFVQVHLPDGTSQHIVLTQAAADRVGYLDNPTGDRSHSIVRALIAALLVYQAQVPDVEALTHDLLTRLPK